MSRIKHMVLFNLKSELSKEQVNVFFNQSLSILTKIDGVNNFISFDQISKKNDFKYGFSMEFDSQDSYDYYSNHQMHTDYVKNIWLTNVDTFLEIDCNIK